MLEPRLVPALLAALLLVTGALLQGCGGGSSPSPSPSPIDTNTTTTTTSSTSTTTTSSGASPSPVPPLPGWECPSYVKATLKTIAERYVSEYGVASMAGYVGPVGDGRAVCAGGHVAYPPSGRHADNISSSSRSASLSRHAKFVYGSFTKVWTASAVLKLHEEGKIDIDKPAWPFIERVYKHAMNESLTSVFKTDLVKQITPRQLMAMRSGIDDYDANGEVYKWQEKNPDDDLSPSRTVKGWGHMYNGVKPGTCGVYSSMGFVLLGMLLMGQSGVLEWDQYDQNVWRHHFPDIEFATRGHCSKYTDVAGKCKICSPHGVLDVSCTNGFTCGNMVAYPRDAARFLWMLLNGKLLKPETVQEMLKFQPLGQDGANKGTVCSSFGMNYGLGMQAPADGATTGGEPPEMFPGHAGLTWGYSTINAYDVKRRAVYAAGIATSDVTAQAVWFDLHNNIKPDKQIVV